MCVTGFVSSYLEKNLTWMAHVSGVCMVIIVSLLLSNIGLIPSSHQLYDFFLSEPVLVALILMTLGLSIKEIKNLPLKTLILFSVGAIGTCVGGLLAALVAYKSLGDDAFTVAAQLSASYIGGGENAVAIKNIFQINNELFVTAFAIDNVITTIWFFITLTYAPPAKLEAKSGNETSDVKPFDGTPFILSDFLLTLSVAFIIFHISSYLNSVVGIHKILLMTVFSIFTGQINPLRKKLTLSYLIGSLIFIFFFFSIGAISSFQGIAKVPLAVIAMPAIIVFVHAVFMLVAQRILRVDSLTVSVCSQSLIGGPATAVAVAQAKRSSSAITLGLLLGLLGYAIGTFCGVGVFHLAKIFIGN